MANQFDRIFTDDMKPKQLFFVFNEVYDNVERGSEEEKELIKAYQRAVRATYERLAKEEKELRKKYAIEGKDCIIIWPGY